MVNAIADALKQEIEALGFVDRIEGMVTTALQRNRDGSRQRFPAVCGKGLDKCDPRELVPNDKYCSIIYFEDNGTRERGGSNCNVVELESNIRLVCWYNVTKFGDQCSYSDLFIAYILQNLLCKQISFSSYAGKARVTLDRIPTKDSSIFSRYDYNDSVDYMFYPYDFFAIDFRITYSFCKNVTLEDITKDADACVYS